VLPVSRRALIVLTGDGGATEPPARALAGALNQAGVEAHYLGRQDDPRRIAAAVVEANADAVELCLGPRGGVSLLRQLLVALTEVGRRDVSIVIHRAR
jgi:methylmalonyl-CoA mutase cobalamin-binding domain/chain